jgi:hypothetical protein
MAPLARPKLGNCCICSNTRKVRTIVSLNLRAPIPEHGWGCVVCNVSGGAMAVVCDLCCDQYGDDVPKQLLFACRGYPATDGRVPIAELTEPFGHDLSKHPEVDLDPERN